jgi:hypothetical protein
MRRDDQAEFDRIRDEKFTKADPFRAEALRTLAAHQNGLRLVCPYVETADRLLPEFRGRSWEDVNKPTQKWPIHEAFRDYRERVRVYPHQNFQLGDSGIADHFETLLKTEVGNGCRSVVSIYNRLAQEGMPA